MSKSIICLLCGGQSTEHEVSLMSARNVVAAIPRDKYELLIVGIDKTGAWHLYENSNAEFTVNSEDPVNIALAPGGTVVSPVRFNDHSALAILEGKRAPLPFDLLFPVMHGRNGEDGAIQGLAQLLGCPCVGCGMTASAICMDKACAKQILEYEGIRTARWILVTRGEEPLTAETAIAKLGLPLFVKPANAGSSVGVVKVRKASEFDAAIAEAMKYDDRVLVEECIVGREIECAVMGNHQLFCAVPGEVVPKLEFYSYDAKYTLDDGAELRAPAQLTDDEIARVHAIASKAYKALGCKGMSRVDFFLKPDGTYILNEINTIPGFTKISMFPRLMGLSGVSYSTLVDKLIQLSLEK